MWFLWGFVHFKEIRHTQLKVRFVINFFLLSFNLHFLGRWCWGQNKTNHSTWILHKHKWFSFFVGERSWFQAIWNLTSYILCSQSNRRRKLYLSDIQGRVKSQYFLGQSIPFAWNLYAVLLCSFHWFILTWGNKLLLALKTRLYFMCMSIYTF